MLFEIIFSPPNIVFKTTIAPPGNSQVIQLLYDEMKSIKGAKDPRGEKWLVLFNEKIKYDIYDEQNTDEKFGEIIKNFIKLQVPIINSIEGKLMKIRSELLSIK